ncbi:MAG: CehA/McbA family metallohydrolase [Bacilli bacterium]|nr:CehA/McbA family metallohydrolase [Bacilli bacterium]
MKKYLINPNLRWCKANLHCHTNHSDGYFTPEEIKKYYKAKGYQIVAYTDHELLFDNSYLCDKDFVALTSTEYSLNSDTQKTIHLNLFSKDPHNTFHIATGPKNIREYHVSKYAPNKIKYDGYNRTLTKESVQETIDRANKAGFLVQFNHPNWSLNTRDDYIDLKGLWSLEILNYMTEIETGAEYCINIYDDMLRHGHKLVCTMGDDNHNYHGGFEGSFGGFNYIGVNKLTYSEVFKAMKDGNIYASNGPIIKSLYVDTKEMKVFVECSSAVNIILVGYMRRFMHVCGKNLVKADFNIDKDEPYFRITVKDKNGRVAHTRAYYLKEYQG